MAPLNFEDKIKEKLEQRAIEPSEGSWEKLSGQLDQVQNQKNGNRKIWWYSLAAIFVGVLILTSVFFKNPVSKEVNTQLVDRNTEIVKQNDTEIVQKDNEDHQNIVGKEYVIADTKKNEDKLVVAAEDKTELKRKEKENSQKAKSGSLISADGIKQEKQTIEIVQNDSEIIKIPKQEEALSINPEVINSKIADIVAHVEELQKNNAEVTDEEINELLLKAQKDITTQKILKSNTVSASALLQDVEEEIDETFKQKVFEALKAGFQKVKTAVAEREN